MSRECHSCGATGEDTVLPARKPHRGALVCSDCRQEAERAGLRAEERETRPKIRTRASYRAAFRHRAILPQTDLVDLLVVPA